jgi:uncharacterized membrane protein
MNEKTPPQGVSLPAAPAGQPSVDKQALEALIRESVKDILSGQQQRQVTERLIPRLRALIFSVTSSFHAGPVPSTETARGYESILPGAFERVLKMAEKDQDAVIDSNRAKLKSDSQYRLCCLASGFVALCIILGIIVYLAIAGQKEAALAVAGLGAVGIISTFVNARLAERQPH